MRGLFFYVCLFFSLISFALWTSDPTAGLKEAQSEGKLVMFYFHSEHCPYCTQMETFVLGDEDVSKHMENFIVISLNTDSSMGRKWTRQLGVFGTPTFVVYDPKQAKPVSIIFGSRSKDDFIQLILHACRRSSIKKC
ncbi:MAG: thioredoxin family protein [Aquificaceae bacterium]